MDTSNLFERIEGYAQENFTTETLAYILDNDPRVKRAFLDLLLSRLPPNRRRELRKAFRSCEIETQRSFDFGRPDLTIESSDGNARAFVEIKTQSQEGESQIQRYLEGGHVAYLTPFGYDVPDLDGASSDKYLGQFFWHEVYLLIHKKGSRDALHRQFLKYLEVRGMGPPKEISKDDLSASLHAADAIRKFQALVEAVRKEIESEWANEFGKNVGGRSVYSGLTTGDLPYWWFRSGNWKRRQKRLFFAIGVYVEEGANEPLFYVELGTSQKFGRQLEKNPKFRKLRSDTGWKPYTSRDEWSCYKTFSIGTGNIDKIGQQQIRNLRSVKEELRKLVKFVEKKL